MSKQVLTVKQMQNLQELGLELKEDTIIFKEGIPLYTLQDILDILLKFINGYKLEMGVRYDQSWFVTYIGDFQSLRYECEENLIDAAYELLCWAVENGYVETNKEQ